MTKKIRGGLTSYGHVAGILMNDSAVPRIPGDPGHAETFSFPVIFEVLKGFPFQDLIEAKKNHLDILLDRAKRLEQRGVSFVAADCGLFSPYQQEMKDHLSIPFIGSALDLIPLLAHHQPSGMKTGIITGDTRILGPVHLEASGIDPASVVTAGMENCSEFNRVVIKGAQTLDVDAVRQGVTAAANRLSSHNTAAVVLECTNLIPFRKDVQKQLKQPVFDLVSLIEFYTSGFMKRCFSSSFLR